MAQDSANVAET